ncbi:MAG: acyl--CoA ligase, partial [Alphaproteobacteria bacterium]|nr:acyl--CoA ligase [Alphaproteobacteria bacterium]
MTEGDRAAAGRTLFTLLRAQAERFANRPAVVAGGRSTTYRELLAAATRVAGGLAVRGIGRGSRVGVLTENRREWLEAVFGAAALGAVAVPLSTWSREGELDWLIGDAQLDAVIAVAAFAGQNFAAPLTHLQPRHPRLKTVVIISEPSAPRCLSYADFIAAAAPHERDEARPDDDALILYTSGSSARPKAVRLRHGATVANGFAIGERMALTEADRVLLAPPLFWAYGAVNALPATLAHGAALVLQPRFEAGGWLDLIEAERCTAVYTLPSMTGAAIRHPGFRRARTASLRTGLMIGSAEEVRIAAEELAVPQICNVYGATETYGNCAVTPCGWPLPRRMQSQGPPLPGMAIRIVDPDSGRTLPAGEVGAVEVGGLVTPGYCGASAEHNAAAFTADGCFRTGDIAALDPSGDFRFVARGSDIIKRAGINVSPAEVESLLLRHPAVAQAAVV